jgi:hypothetical protein
MSIQEDWADQQGRKPGMSSTAKVLIVLAGVGGVFALLCCGGIAFFGWKAKQAIESAMSTDPAVIRENTRKIVDIEIPEGLEPTQSFDIFGVKMVVYSNPANDGSVLMLMELNAALTGNTKQQRDQMLNSLRLQGQQPADVDAEIDEETVQTRHFMIQNKKVPFDFAKGMAGGKGVRQVTGSIPTRRGVALFTLVLAEERYDEAAVLRVLKSMGAEPVTGDGSEDASHLDDDATSHETRVEPKDPSDDTPDEAAGEEPPP